MVFVEIKFIIGFGKFLVFGIVKFLVVLINFFKCLVFVNVFKFLKVVKIEFGGFVINGDSNGVLKYKSEVERLMMED